MAHILNEEKNCNHKKQIPGHSDPESHSNEHSENISSTAQKTANNFQKDDR